MVLRGTKIPTFHYPIHLSQEPYPYRQQHPGSRQLPHPGGTSAPLDAGFVHAVWPEQPPHSSLSQTIAENPYISGGMCHLPRKYSCWIRPTKKRLSSLPSPPGTDCLKPTGEPTLLLGAAMTANPRSLYITLQSPLVPSAFEGLVDSGSFDCFLDSVFMARMSWTASSDHWLAITAKSICIFFSISFPLFSVLFIAWEIYHILWHKEWQVHIRSCHMSRHTWSHEGAGK